MAGWKIERKANPLCQLTALCEDPAPKLRSPLKCVTDKPILGYAAPRGELGLGWQGGRRVTA